MTAYEAFRGVRGDLSQSHLAFSSPWSLLFMFFQARELLIAMLRLSTSSFEFLSSLTMSESNISLILGPGGSFVSVPGSCFELPSVSPSQKSGSSCALMSHLLLSTSESYPRTVGLGLCFRLKAPIAGSRVTPI